MNWRTTDRHLADYAETFFSYDIYNTYYFQLLSMLQRERPLTRSQQAAFDQIASASYIAFRDLCIQNRGYFCIALFMNIYPSYADDLYNIYINTLYSTTNIFFMQRQQFKRYYTSVLKSVLRHLLDELY